MPRVVMPTQHQLATAAVIDFILAHADGTQARSTIQRKVAARMAELDPDKAISQRLSRNFKTIPIRARTRAFGKFSPGELTAASFAENGALKASPSMTMMKFDDVGPVVIPTFPLGTRFDILYTGLYCRDESGDRGIFRPSDEPYVVTVAVSVEDGENVERDELHPVGDPAKHYTDVDDGESRHGPIAAVWSGTLPSHEISLVTVVMEHDDGDPDFYKEEIAVVVGAVAAVAAALGLVVPAMLIALSGLVVNWLVGSEDDVLGTAVTIISIDSLQLLATHPTQELVRQRTVLVPDILGAFTLETVIDNTGLQRHVEAHIEGEAEYFVTFKYSADQEPLEPPVDPSGRPKVKQPNINQGQRVIVA